MYKLVLNIFCTEFVCNAISNNTVDGSTIKKMRLVNSLLDEFESNLEEYRNFQLTRSSAIAEKSIKALVYSLLGKTRDERTPILNEWVKNDRNFDLDPDPEVQYAIDNKPEFKLKRSDWNHCNIPKLTFILKEEKINFLKGVFNENAVFPEASMPIAILTTDAIEDSKEISEKELKSIAE